MFAKAERIDEDEFEEIEEFEMPLETNFWMYSNIDREIDILNKFAKEHGLRGFTEDDLRDSMFK